jgi:hypothetical protein
MVTRNTTRAVVGVSTVLLVVVTGVTAVSAVDTAAAAHEDGDHPDWIHEENHTVQPTTHKPGEEAGVEVWASLPDDERYGAGWEEVWFAANWMPAAFSPEGNESQCTFEDIRTGGVDRGANNSGTTIDESVVDNVKSFWIDENDDGQPYIMVELYKEEDIGGDPLHLNYTDQVVVVLDECFTVPDEPGWYRVGSYMNGTLWEGGFLEGAGYSHYTYVCDCESREEAVEVLGRPPVEGYGHEGSKVKAEADELDEEPPDSWDLAAPREPGEWDGTATPTTTPDGTATATSEPTATATPTSTDTPAPTTTARGAPTDTGGGSEEVTATASVGGTDDGPAAGDGQEESPAAGDGTGPGPVVALFAILGGALLVARFDR